MTRSTRRIIFYFLVLAFVIVGPLATAYSFGYSFNFSSAKFESTGGIFIRSHTPRAAAFLDGAFMRETGLITGGALLIGLEPGNHLVRLEKEGFRPWTKIVRVEPGEVTELRDIFIVPYAPAIATSTRLEFVAAQATSTPVAAFMLDKKGDLALGSGVNRRVLAENVHDFIQAGDAVYFVGKNGFFANASLSGDEIATIGRPGFYIDQRRFSFIRGPGALAIIDSGEGLFLFDEATRAIEPSVGGVKDAVFDLEAEGLLIRKDYSVDILRLKDNRRQPFQKKGLIETIGSSSAPVREALWFYKTGAHIVWRTRDGVYLTEADGRGGRNTIELVSGPVDDILTSPTFPNAIFWRKEKEYYRMDL